METQELKDIRAKILSDITPLVLESQGQPADRFELLLRIAQSGNATTAIYRQAYDSASAIEPADERLRALLALLDEVDFDVTASDEQPEQPTTEPAVETFAS